MNKSRYDESGPAASEGPTTATRFRDDGAIFREGAPGGVLRVVLGDLLTIMMQEGWQIRESWLDPRVFTLAEGPTSSSYGCMNSQPNPETARCRREVHPVRHFLVALDPESAQAKIHQMEQRIQTLTSQAKAQERKTKEESDASQEKIDSLKAENSRLEANRRADAETIQRLRNGEAELGVVRELAALYEKEIGAARARELRAAAKAAGSLRGHKE